MAIQLTQTEFQRLVNIIQKQPEFRSQADRSNFLTLSFGMTRDSETILSRMNLSGAPLSASVEVIRFLCDYGQISQGVESLGMLLDQLMMQSGISPDADFMADLVEKYQLNNPPLKIDIPAELPAENVNPDTSTYVFISYARPQQSIAELLENHFQAVGFKVFRDTTSIRAGNNWDIKIEEALDQATHMVLLLSTASMPYRKEVHREWFAFDQNQKPIIPLYLQDCKLHSRMLAYNYIDGRTDLEQAINQIAERLLQGS